MEENKKKSLGLLDATFLVAGSMIGSGIFIVSSDMAKDLGGSGWLLMTWLLTGVITLFGALSYGELAAMFPKAGGQFVYIKEAWGRLTAFTYGWTVFTVIQTGVIAAVGVAFGKFAGIIFPSLNTILFTYKDLGFNSDVEVKLANVIGLGTIALLTWLNVRGIQYGKIIQTIFTSSKLLALTVLIIAGIWFGFSQDGFFEKNLGFWWNDMEGVFNYNPDVFWKSSKTIVDSDGNVFFETFLPMGLLIAVSTTIINSLFSSDAWNNVTFIAGDIRNPERNLPKALFWGTFIVTILYLLANVAYLGLLPLDGTPIPKGIDPYTRDNVLKAGIQFAHESRVGTSSVFMLLGNAANVGMAVLIMISTFGCNNGLIMAGSRLFYAMSKDGLFFKKASQLNAFGVPAWAMWAQGIWAMILCMSGSYKILIIFATFGSMIFYIITIAAIFKLRRTMPDAHRPYKAFGYPVIPALYILLALGICISLTVFTFWDTIGSIVLILFGIPVYYLAFNRKESTEEQ